MKIYLVRHMQSEWNKLGKLQGVTDIDLSEEGKEHARRFTESISIEGIDAIYSSDKLRTKYLATRLAKKYELDLEIVEDLHEVNVGEWSGQTWPDIKVKYADFLKGWFEDNENIPMPGGESYRDLVKRVMSVIDEIKVSKKENVLVITHGAVIRAILCHILGMRLIDRSKFDIDNGSITSIEYLNDRLRVNYVNHRIDLK